MSSHRIVSIVIVLMLTWTPSSAWAFFDAPWITPASPTASDVVSVNIHGGICDGIFEWPGYPQITRNGNAVHVVEYGVHEDFQDWCIYPIGTYVVSLGTFSQGDYTLTVDFAYDDYPFGLTTINLGVIPFSVGGTPPVVEVPASTPSGLTALLVLIGCSALRGLRMRRA